MNISGSVTLEGETEMPVLTHWRNLVLQHEGQTFGYALTQKNDGCPALHTIKVFSATLSKDPEINRLEIFFLSSWLILNYNPSRHVLP